MDTTIRNLDEATYRALKARAALAGKTIGEAITEAMRDYLRRPLDARRSSSILDLEPGPYGEGNERLSEQIDEVVYGTTGDRGGTGT